MAGELYTQTKVGGATWRTDYSGTGPYERWYEGKIIADFDGLDQTTDESLSLPHDDAEEPPAIEVIDTSGADVAESETYPPYLILQWRDYPSEAQYYKIEYDDGGGYDDLDPPARVLADNRGYYRYETNVLADVTEHPFRVIPVNSEADELPELDFTVTMVRNPDVPSITLTYNSGTGAVTVSARS